MGTEGCFLWIKSALNASLRHFGVAQFLELETTAIFYTIFFHAKEDDELRQDR